MQIQLYTIVYNCSQVGQLLEDSRNPRKLKKKKKKINGAILSTFVTILSSIFLSMLTF